MKIKTLTNEERIKISESTEATYQAVEDAHVNGDLSTVLYRKTIDFLDAFKGRESEMANMMALTSI